MYLHGTEASLEVTGEVVRLHQRDQTDSEVITFAPEGNLLGRSWTTSWTWWRRAATRLLGPVRRTTSSAS